MIARDRDGGFILIDALAGATILAFAGSVIILIDNAAITRASDDLERSVAIMTLDGMAAELKLVEPASISVALPYEQDGLRFEVAPGPEAYLQTLSAYQSKAKEQPLFTLDVAITVRRPEVVGP